MSDIASILAAIALGIFLVAGAVWVLSLPQRRAANQKLRETLARHADLMAEYNNLVETPSVPKQRSRPRPEIRDQSTWRHPPRNVHGSPVERRWATNSVMADRPESDWEHSIPALAGRRQHRIPAHR